MPDIASALKSEIARISRKVLRQDLVSLRKTTVAYRHEIAALKQRIHRVERRLKLASKNQPTQVTGQDERPSGQLRFSAARFATQRKKLGLSAAKYAKLLGVSALSVYKWESGQTRPRQAQLEVIAALRNLGKREAAARLEQLEAAE